MYNRHLHGRTLTLAASGWTWSRIFVLQDYETGSLWHPGLSFAWTTPWLVCVAGPLQGERLYAEEFFRGTWQGWLTEHPGSKIMQSVK